MMSMVVPAYARGAERDGPPGYTYAAILLRPQDGLSNLSRSIPTGPSRTDLTRLGVGLPGVRGLLASHLANVVRKRRPPPPVSTDPPRKTSGMDPWLL
jgi:hypothetical protein